MTLKNNIHYFNTSIENQEPEFDERYAVLQKHPDLERYIDNTKEIKEILTTIKTLDKLNENTDTIYKKLYELTNNEFASKSEWGCFINACDITLKSLNDSSLLKKMVFLYFQYRDLRDGVPSEWVQAIIDKGANRAKGSIGENKLTEIAKNLGFKFVDNWNDFSKNEKVITKFSKNNFDITNIKKNLNVDLNFDSQNKMLDVILKNNEKIIFLEAKHLKEGGGAQDKQIKELISIISHSTNRPDVFYGAFLDGIYSNVILNISNEIEKKQETKIIAQQKDILKALKNNKNSFWFNTAGFIEFVKDFGS